VTDAEVSNDFSYAKIFVSFMGSDDKEEQLARLNKAKGFIRSGLAKRLDIRKTPELTFVYDDTLDKAMHLEELLKKVEKK
ncbi:MAG: 30S ribosome-binding factor RbfA, partial [Bacilli bacterium]